MCNNLFTTLDEVADVDLKDIDKVAASFAKQPPGSWIIFGHRHTKFLKLFIHWAQDFERVSEDVEYTGQHEDFLNELHVADDRAKVRAALADKTDTLSHEASPGKLDNECKWTEWEQGFVNLLSTIPGSNGVPLSYVIHENKEPLEEEEELEGLNFTQQCVAC